MSFLKRIFNKKISDESANQDLIRTTPAPSADEKPITSPSLQTEKTDGDPNDTLPLTRRVSDFVTRPLSPEPVISSRNSHITFGLSSDTGMVRSNNQDSALSFFFTSKSADEQPDFGLFIVADGMGGHHDGEKASSLTARTIATYITNNIYLPMLDKQEDNSDKPTISEALVAAVKKANESVLSQVPDGGTTLTAMAVIGDLAHIVHVGDSRAYLVTKDGLEKLTRDHSLVERLIELNQLSREDAIGHPQSSVLYRAVGQNEMLEVDTFTRRLPANSFVLICSDGLWGLVEESEIIDIIHHSTTPQEACDRLIAKANLNGGTDNITAILLKIPSR